MFRALCFHCRGKGSVPGQGTKILHAAQLSPKIKEWGSFFNSSQCNLFALCIAYFPFQWHVGEKGDSLNLFSFSFFFSRLKNAVESRGSTYIVPGGNLGILFILVTQ